MKPLTTLWVVGMFATTVAMADDVDDVKAAVQNYFAALNSGDVNAWVQLYSAGHTNFSPDGGLLARSDSLEEQRKNRQAEFNAGLKFNLQPRHIEVRDYGNLTAVATSYVVGTINNPDGTTDRLNARRTAVLIKQGGQWKLVHRHISPLRLSQ